MEVRRTTRSAREVLAQNLRRLREERQLSQEDLAALIGFHRTYVSHVERSRANITLDNIERIARYFDVATSVMLLDALDAASNMRA